ncbi:hypothetical protein M8C21_012280, partial [Ambrosia artemisiifolia]
NILSDCARVFTIINDCDETIWPAFTPGESFGGGGYALRAKESRVHTAPSELSVKAGGKVAACRSACDVFNTDEYCCRGNYGNSATCKPTSYSKKFKEACPTSYSYAYDDPTSIFTCSEADYTITFCGSKYLSLFALHFTCFYRHNPVLKTWVKNVL